MASPVSEAGASRDFFEQTLADAGQWTRFADSKGIAALAILGLAFANLLPVVRPLVDARELDSVVGWVATIAFWMAIACAVLTVLCVVRALFPRVEPAGSTRVPLYFFAHVAAFGSPLDYEREVRRRSAHELESAIAAQAWEVARIAAIKHRYATAALQAVAAFLVCWAVARLALALST